MRKQNATTNNSRATRKPGNIATGSSNASRPDNGTNATIANGSAGNATANPAIDRDSSTATAANSAIEPTGSNSAASRGTDGRGDGRIQQSRTGTNNTAANRNTGGNSRTEQIGNVVTQSNELDVELNFPTPKIKRKYTKRTKVAESTGSDEIIRLAILTAINTLVNTAFNGVAIITKDKKWNLSPDEAIPISQDIDQCLALLPNEQYETIIKYLSTISPFASLATNLAGVIKKRIETNSKPIANSAPPSVSVANDTQQQQTNVGGNWPFDTRYTAAFNGN